MAENAPFDGNMANADVATSLAGITEVFAMTKTGFVRLPLGLLTGTQQALPSASVSGYALVQGRPATFDVTMTGIATVWAAMRRLGVEEGVRVQRTGNGPVVLTAGNAGSYDAVLFDAPAGGSLLAETSAFAVAAPAASATITGSAPTQGQSGSFLVDLQNIDAAYVILARAGVEEGARVARVGDGTVLLTPLASGSYAARVYSAAGGGVVLAETPAFSVGNAQPIGSINTPGGTLYTGAPVSFNGGLEYATAGYLALVVGGSEGTRQPVTLNGTSWSASLTPASAGTYTARLYTAASGGVLVAETNTFAVAVPPVTATISGSASTAEVPASFAVAVSSSATVYAVLARAGTEEGTRVARAGTGNVSLTPLLAGGYTARVYSAASGGSLLVETAPFTVALPVMARLADHARIASFGDSMTARVSTPNAYTTNATDSTYNNGFLNWMRALGRQRFQFRSALNFGVTGDTLAQMLARAGDIEASDAQAVLFRGGINSIRGNVTLPDMISAATQILDRLRARFGLVILEPVMPNGDWGTNPTAGYVLACKQLVRDLNTFYAEYAASRSRVLWLGEEYTEWLDTATQEPKALYTVDKLHQTALGAYRAAKVAMPNLVNVLGTAEWPLQAGAADIYNVSTRPTGNKLSNGQFTGTTGSVGTGATGVVPTGWGVATNQTANTGPITCSIEAATDGLGDWLRIDWNRSGVAERLTLQRQETYDPNLYQGGEKVRFGVEFDLLSATNLANLNLLHRDSQGTGGVNFDTREMYPFDSAVAGPGEAHSGIMLTNLRTIAAPTGTGTMRQSCYIQLDLASANSGGSVGSIRLRRPTLAARGIAS